MFSEIEERTVDDIIKEVEDLKKGSDRDRHHSVHFEDSQEGKILDYIKFIRFCNQIMSCTSILISLTLKVLNTWVEYGGLVDICYLNITLQKTSEVSCCPLLINPETNMLTLTSHPYQRLAK